MKIGLDGPRDDSALEKVPEHINGYALIATKLGISDTAIVYYSCCGNDNYPQVGFPKNRFIFIDGNEINIAALQSAGKEAYCRDVRNFNPVPEGIDVLIVENPMLSPLELIGCVKPGGVIIANDYNASAKILSREPSVELVATLHRPRSISPEWNQVAVQDCFVKAETTADLLSAGMLTYCREMLDLYGVDIEGDNIAARYQVLFKRHFNQDSDFSVIEDSTNKTIFLAPLPTKHSFDPNDVAIFRKRLVTSEQLEARINATIEELEAVLPEPFEPWVTRSLQSALGISIVGDSKESILRSLRLNKLNLIQLHTLQNLIEYFSLREYWKLKFKLIAKDMRFSFKFNLEENSGVRGDPAFKVVIPENDTLGADFFGSDDNPQAD